MKLPLITSIIAALLFVGCFGAQKKSGADGKNIVVLKDTYAYPQARIDNGSKEKIRVYRGEAAELITLASEAAVKGWIKVKLSGGESSGWLKKEFTHQGLKLPITLTERTTLHIRPDNQSKSLRTLQRGTSMFILKSHNGWKKVSIEFQKRGWIKTSDYVEGLKLSGQ